MSNSQYKTSKQPDRRKPQPKNLGPRLRKKFDIKYKSFEEPSSIKTNFPNAKKVEENNKNHEVVRRQSSDKDHLSKPQHNQKSASACRPRGDCTPNSYDQHLRPPSYWASEKQTRPKRLPAKSPPTISSKLYYRKTTDREKSGSHQKYVGNTEMGSRSRRRSSEVQEVVQNEMPECDSDHWRPDLSQSKGGGASKMRHAHRESSSNDLRGDKGSVKEGTRASIRDASDRGPALIRLDPIAGLL